MDKQTINIDLKNVRSTKDVIMRFSKALKLHDLRGNSWDAFNDFFRNLDTDSEIVSNIKPTPQYVHLIIKNIFDVAKFSEEEYSILCEILVEATDINNRGDNIKFTFEVHNDKS